MLKVSDDILTRIKQCNIALIYGGSSPEHDVSIQSAIGVYTILKSLCHTVYLVGISKNNTFYLQNATEDSNGFRLIENFKILNEINETNSLSLIPGRGIAFNDTILPINVAFPVTHGKYGEDGKLQGLLSICNIKVCGCDTTSSSICMSKAHCSSILNDYSIPTIKTLVFDKYNKVESLIKVQNMLSKNLFIKSETTGSSIGVHTLKNNSEADFISYIEDSFQYSERVLVQPLYENFVEIECAALEYNGEIEIGGPGVVEKPTSDELLSYKSKYAAVDGAVMNTNHNLDSSIVNKTRELAKKIFSILHLSGYARIDFFLTKNNEIILNEINTLPGMTKTSHYPLLINSESISMNDAIALIISEALDAKR